MCNTLIHKHLSDKQILMLFFCYVAGWAIPTASHKSVLQVALSMVLAILLLELCGFVHSGYLLLLTGVIIFYVGKICQTKNPINVHMFQGYWSTCIESRIRVIFANKHEYLAF